MNKWVENLADFIGLPYEKTGFIIVLIKTFAAFTVAFFIWLCLKRLISFFEKRFQNNTFIKVNIKIFSIIRKALLYALVLGTGTYLIRLYKFMLVEKAFYALLIMLFASPINDFFLITLKYLESRLAEKTETKVDDIIFDLLNKFAGVIVYSVAVILALDTLGINVMPFIAGAGVAGIAIGFAAKDTLSNLIAGVLLIIDRPFEIGDRIEVWSAPSGSATWGDVIDIGLRATKIKTTDNIVIIIPNNEIMKRDIVNYTIITSKIRIRINIGIAYNANMEKAKEIILKVADSIQWILKTPSPKVVVRNFGESSVDLQLRVWIDDARRRMDTVSYITDNVKTEFDKEGIEIPYPKRDIIITQKNE